MTIDEFRKNVKKHGNAPDIEVLEFNGTENPCKVFCKRCGSEFTISQATYLYYGRKCKRCAINNVVLTHTISSEEFMKNIKEKGNAPDIVLVGEYVNTRSKAKFKCLRCGTEFYVRANNLYRGRCCPNCFKIQTYTKHNHCKTIYESNQEMFLLLKNKNDGYKYCPSSHMNLEWICPNCGSTVVTSPMYVKRHNSLSCPFCSDGVSYPNKFFSNLLNISGIEFKSEVSFDWSKFKNKKYYRYDFYVEKYNMIIEAMGDGHFSQWKYGKSLEEIQSIDIEKETLAINNGIKYYFAIDCRYSELNFIKDSILFSELHKFLPKNIDWNFVDKKSRKSLLLDVCELYKMDNTISTGKISEIVRLDKSTVLDYLKKGSKIGLCDYDVSSAYVRGSLSSDYIRCKPVLLLDDNGNIVKRFKSPKDASSYVGIYPESIRRICNAKTLKHNIMYEEDFK